MTFQKGNQFRKGLKPANAFPKGSIPWNKNKKDIHLSPNSEFKKGEHSSPKTEFKKGRLCNSPRNKKGCPKAKNSYSFPKGGRPWNKGITGEGNSNWKGGISYEPYSIEWTNTLKESIRQRDNYTCQLCGRTQDEELERYERKLPVHHIDYDKKNCDPKKLIILCCRCNSKVNFNREYWKKYFNEKKYEK